MIELLQSVGQRILHWLQWLGRGALFGVQLVRALPLMLVRPRLVVQQIYSVGVLSLPIILLAGLFVGMVLGLQGYTNLVDFGAVSSLGTLVALSLVRELGPVVGALLYVGRAGSALTAEIGLMRATEQLSSLEIMAVDPFQRVLAPRYLAGVIAVPMLGSLFTAVGILGGYLIAVKWLGVDSGSYWSQMQSSVQFWDDVFNGVILKSLCFGMVVNAIALFEGYDAYPSSEGVSRATTRTVVNGSIAVLGLDFLLTALMFGDL